MRSALKGVSVGIGLLMLVAAVHLTSAAFGEDKQSAGSRDETAAFDPIPFGGRTDFQVSALAEVPRQVARAAQRENCDVEKGMKEIPLRFLVERERRLVLVYCQWILGSHLVFDLKDARHPKLVVFPFLAQNTGFGTTPRPGLITWRKEAGEFEAETGTDMCPSSRLRHVYRLGRTEGFTSGTSSFVLVRVDVTARGCGGNQPWSTVWQAPNWPEAMIVR
ncbi:hypothetical protein AOQ72_12855 [Bradyrhizobium yuanmingense]|uniref:DUF1176 domain-containing protein n=1 Tax=Bradyrhizobium yuanmingense TaxID=108015 RepID=A0A0R3CNU4_9BRAD|nr:hypothetical protein [Bradyrhizobium yuanmingense]KRP99413.1 hypothetical protein AOQ72_12855 [Bradyrhizobium yuanmingense]